MATDHIHPDSVWRFELARIYTKGLSSRRTVVSASRPSTSRKDTALAVIPQLRRVLDSTAALVPFRDLRTSSRECSARRSQSKRDSRRHHDTRDDSVFTSLVLAVPMI